MATEIKVKSGTQFRFFVVGSFSPVDEATNWSEGTPDDTGVLTLSAVADAAGRQSTKVDLGATRAARYACLGCVDYTGETPVAGQTVKYYWAPSTDSIQANGNIAGNSGADGACPDGALGSITLAEFINLCVFIGPLSIHDGAVVQNGLVGVFAPPTRYGQLIVVNNGGGAFEADDIEMHQILVPIIDESQ